MTYVVSAWSESGGEGKTSLGVHLAAGLSIRGKSALLVDLDPQASGTRHLGHEPDGIPGSAALVKGRTKNAFVSYEPPARGMGKPFRLSPASPELYLIRGRGGFNADRFRETLEGLPEDFVILDLGPGYSGLTISALLASDEVLCPVRVNSSKGLDSTEQVLRSIGELRSENPGLDFGGVVPWQVGGTSKLVSDVLKYLKRNYGRDCYRARIRNSVRMPESMCSGVPVFDLDGRMDGPSGDLLKMVDEFLRRNKKRVA